MPHVTTVAWPDLRKEMKKKTGNYPIQVETGLPQLILIVEFCVSPPSPQLEWSIIPDGCNRHLSPGAGMLELLIRPLKGEE